MKNILLICCLLLSFYGNAQLKLSKSWEDGLLYSKNNTYFNGIPKKVVFKEDKRYKEIIEWNKNGSHKSYWISNYDKKDITSVQFNYDENENLLSSRMVSVNHNNDTLWTRNKICKRNNDTLYVINYQDVKDSIEINYVTVEYLDRIQNVSINYEFFNKGWWIKALRKRTKIDSVEKLNNLESIKNLFNQGIISVFDSIVTHYNTLQNPIKICHKVKQRGVKDNLNSICFEFQYIDNNKGYMVLAPNDRSAFFLDKNKEIHPHTPNINMVDGVFLDGIKIEAIKLDKYGNWKRRKIYDESQKKWITQRRKIKYW